MVHHLPAVPFSVTFVAVFPLYRALAMLAVAPMLLTSQPPRRPAPPRDTLTAAQRDTVRGVTRDARRLARQRTAPDSIARRARAAAGASGAFADSSARRMLDRARVARLRQDSALLAYRATTTQRIRMGVGARRLGLEKLFFLSDNVAQIAWRRGVGVRVTPLGSRVVVPMASRTSGQMYGAVSIPYFPGREQLWFPSSSFGVVNADIDEREYIHPLAGGAEAYYRYATGDSAAITLPTGQRIALRELRITAQRPDRRLFVGSFWFDQESGQLVRAAYRMAVAFEIWDVAREESARERVEADVAERLRDSLARVRLSPDAYRTDSAQRARRPRSSDENEPPAVVKALFRPARAQLDGITVEYGLHEGRFWLPRQHSATATAEFGPMRVPFTMDEQFRYDMVNGDFPLAPIPSTRLAAAPGDSGRRDTMVVEGVTGRVNAGGGMIEARTGSPDDTTKLSSNERIRRRLCQRDSVYTRVESRYDGALRVAFDVPCDERQLETSASLPPLDNDALFDPAARDALLEALDFSLQSAWLPRPPRLRTGSDLWRYNRIEGLSGGVQVDVALGGGYNAMAQTRFGLADQHLNAEVALARTTGARTVTAAAYHRLSAVNPEWAGALSLGPSLPALLYGRDEGFYYRKYGASLGERRVHRRGAVEVQAFLERQWTAGDTTASTRFSFARWFTDRRFRDNILAGKADLAGVSALWSRVLVDRPAGLRVTTTARTEVATGTYTYGRVAIDGTVQRPVGRFTAALSGAVGSSAGRVPLQRGWYVGGVRTVRGQIPGTQAGDAFWLGRAELGTRQGIVRPILFYDAGWAGSRDGWARSRPQQGAGIGVGLLDGLLRVDLARGLYPAKAWRLDFYLDGVL